MYVYVYVPSCLRKGPFFKVEKISFVSYLLSFMRETFISRGFGVLKMVLFSRN